MKLPRFACACRLSELPARAEQARQLAEAEATILTALAVVLGPGHPHPLRRKNARPIRSRPGTHSPPNQPQS